MKRKYFVKEVSVATETNPSFAGQTLITYRGKGDHVLGYDGDHADANHLPKGLNAWMAKEYGYDSEAHARRNYTYRNPENSKYWQSTVSIEAVDIYKRRSK